jgi:hypothetical protein
MLRRTYVFARGVNLWVTWCMSVCPGHKSATHYFLCSGGRNAISIKKRVGTRCTELVFLHLVEYVDRAVLFQCVWGAKHQQTIFHARVRGTDVAPGQVRLNMCFCIQRDLWVT